MIGESHSLFAQLGPPFKSKNAFQSVHPVAQLLISPIMSCAYVSPRVHDPNSTPLLHGKNPSHASVANKKKTWIIGMCFIHKTEVQT